MKKKLWIPIVAIVVLLAILFVPVPQRSYDDGGTKEYISLTYKIVAWNKHTLDGVYEKTRIYFGKNRNKSLDELWKYENVEPKIKFNATIVELDTSTALVEPLTEEDKNKSSGGKMFFSISNLPNIEANVGDIVEITYNGVVEEIYPASIHPTDWKISDALRHLEYTEQWLDKNSAEKYDNDIFHDIKITKIYSNCFFARTVVPMPYEIKINGRLSDEWCIGDQIYLTFDNTYYDQENNRVEVDMLSAKESTLQLQPNMNYKPVIYLYPEKEMQVYVDLTLDGKLTCTYPAYNDGWNVTAFPDGTLTDAKGQTYNYLYWEGKTYAQYDLSKGFCIKGTDTAAFLEDALAKIGLTRREANEFIVYWLPLMEQNPYNIISFQTDIYTDAAKLNVNPTPDTFIRVFMAWQASDEYVDIAKQELSAPARTGFTVIEWGGTEIK